MVATTNTFITLHAAAGSGKTYQLVNHLIRILLNGTRPGSVLAITFTRKAAAEMQQRLMQRVYQLAIADERALATELTSLGLGTDSQTCEKAQALYETLLHADSQVQTTTFHAFCQDLLRRFPMEADVPPGFELIERTGYLLDEAWESLLSHITEQPYSEQAKKFDILLKLLGPNTTRQKLNQFIEHRSEWFALNTEHPIDIPEYIANLTQQFGVTNTDPLLEFSQQTTTQQQLQQFVELLHQHPTATNTRHANTIADVLNKPSFDATGFEQLWSAFFTKSHTPLVRKTSKTLETKLGQANSVLFIDLHHQLCERLILIRQQQHALESLALTKSWLTVGCAFLDEYQKLKRMQRLLDFTDLEWHCYQLLTQTNHADWIQYKLDQRIDHLLIDEFQDTNPTQWQFILPLLQELVASEANRSRSVLFVGDSKQSIYRFRRAEPKLFQTASQWVEQQPQAKRAYLNKSYRSSAAIMEFVNRLFTDNVQLQLDDFQQHDTAKTLWGKVSLLPLQQKEELQTSTQLRNPLTTPRNLADPAHYYEAKAIAEHIQALMAQHTIINEENQPKAISYGDIMILFRNRTHAKDYERALREAHIPFIGTERGTLLDSLEIKDMVNLLQWLITPFNNLALAGILRSPLFSASNQDLLSLAENAHWYDTLLEIAPQHSAQHPFARAARHLPSWVQLAERLPVHDLLDHIYSESNLLARYQANYPPHLHSRLQANLTRFIELALESDSGRYPSLTRFLAWLSVLRQQDQEAPDQPAGDTEHQRVRLLTIHESKGLEAPVVYLADATTTPRPKAGPHILVDWPADATKPETFFVSASGAFAHPVCQHTIEQLAQKQSQEEANLLYVAVTRAQQMLLISGVNKSAGWYQQICQQFDVDSDTLEQETLLCQAGTSPQITLASSTRSSHSPDIDPRLQSPLQAPSSVKEIAPSKVHQVGEYWTQSLDEDQQERGKTIHHMLELLSHTPSMSLSHYANLLGSDEKSATLTHYWQEAQQTLHTFSHLFNLAPASKAYAEVPIYYSLDGNMVHGIIDRLIVEPEQIKLIDYKTHRVQSAQHLQSLCQQFTSQLALYKQGIQQLYPHHHIETALLFTATQDYIDIAVET